MPYLLKCLLPCLVLLCSCFLGITQTPSQKMTPTIQSDVERYLEEGNQLMVQQQYEEADIRFTKVIQHYLAQDSIDYLALGDVYIKKEDCMLNLGKFNRALELADSSVSSFQKVTPLPHDNLAAALRARSFVQSQLGNYNQGIQSSQKALEHLSKSDDPDFLIQNKIYNSIAVANFYKQDYAQAILYLQKAISNVKINLGDEHPQLGPYYSNIAINYTRVGDYENADIYYKEATQLFKKLQGEAHPGLHHVNFNRGMNAYALGNIREGINFLEKSLQMRIRQLGEVHPLTGHCYQMIGNGWQELGDYAQAMGYHQKALRIDLQSRGMKHPETARNYAAIAYSYKEKGQLKSAKTYLDSAYVALNYDISQPGQFEQVLLLPTLLNVFVKEADLQLAMYRASGDVQDLQQGREIVNRSVQLIDYAKTTFKEDGTKLVFANAAQPAISIGMEMLYELYQIFRDMHLLEDMWILSERSKNYLLLEAIFQSKAAAFAGVPDSLMKKDQLIKEQIARIEQEIFTEEEQDLSAQNETLVELKGSLLDYKTKYSKLLEELELVAPDYYQLRYEEQLASLPDLQELLTEQQSFVSYYVSEKAIYVFSVNQLEQEIYRVPLEGNLNGLVDSMRMGVFRYHIDREKSRNDYEYWNALYTEKAFQLYQKLVAPVKDSWREEVIIAPSDVIGYIPFSLLLSEMPENPGEFHQHNYLLRDYTISYNYSGTLWKEMSGLPSSLSSSVLAVAPAFPPIEEQVEIAELRRANLGPLAYNQEEVKAIIELIPGQSVVEEQATKDRFLELLPEHSIIHIATHGKLEDRRPDFSFLAFSGTTDSMPYEPLYIRQLYNLDIPAELVVLSACETGLGKLYRGEGIISLARGFSYAGAKSIVPTFWSVNDAAMANLMKRFYTNLSKGMAKNQALRQAKLDYLEGKDPFQSAPYFWASPIVIGDISPISGKASYGWVWWLSGAFVLLGALVMYRWVTRRR